MLESDKVIPHIGLPTRNEYQLSFLWEMKKDFVKNGGAIFPNIPSAQSKFLRAKTNFISCEGRVFEPNKTHSGNSLNIFEATENQVSNRFESLQRQWCEFMAIVKESSEMMEIIQRGLEIYD